MDNNLTPKEKDLALRVALAFENTLTSELQRRRVNEGLDKLERQALETTVLLSALEDEDDLFGIEKHRLVAVLSYAVGEAIVCALRFAQQ